MYKSVGASRRSDLLVLVGRGSALLACAAFLPKNASDTIGLSNATKAKRAKYDVVHDIRSEGPHFIIVKDEQEFEGL